MSPHWHIILIPSQPFFALTFLNNECLAGKQQETICRCCWNVATYKWKVHNGKIEIISFVVKFRSKQPLTVNFEVWVKEGFLLVKLKSWLRKCYGRRHDLVDRYGIYVSQMTTDMFHLSLTLKVWSRPICICGILYFKLNGIDAMNEIIKPRII
jgi:hypothetical protein